MDVSVAFATSLDSPAHIAHAEALGYHRAWLYDTPQQSPDVWMCLALAAQRTSRIGLGPGVLVPTLRHPMVNAAATAALEAMAPGRVAVAFGTGFSGRRALGQAKPITWAYMERYIETYQALLRGGDAEWEGGTMRMLHDATAAADRPVDVPVYLAALGPKGMAIASQLADGLFVAGAMTPELSGFDRVAALSWGTVLDDGEKLDSPRVRAAAGPGWAQVLHGSYEGIGRDFVAGLPGGPAWLEAIDTEPAATRHLAVHDGHCVRLNAADEAAWDDGGGTIVDLVTLTGTADAVRTKVDALAAHGVTEVVYQPAGDIARELNAFASALDLTP